MSYGKGNILNEAFDNKLSDHMLPSFIYVRSVWLDGLFNLITSFTDYSHKYRRYTNTDLIKPYDEWINNLMIVYLYFRSQILKEVDKKSGLRYAPLIQTMEDYINKNTPITFETGRIATLLLNDFAYEIGLTEVTNERKNPKEIMKTPY
jgi:hypothetical protein